MEEEKRRQFVHPSPGEICFVQHENLSAPLGVPLHHVGDMGMHLSGTLYPGLQQDDEVFEFAAT